MNIIATSTGVYLLVLFGIVMFTLAYILSRRQKTDGDTLLVANRSVGWFMGGISIAASWVWAPALFLSSQFAYQMGVAGIFWFIVPNVFAVALFAFIGPKIRDLFSEGYTLPEYIGQRFKSTVVERVYLGPYFFYQVMAVTVQLFAGGNLVTALTGIPLFTVMPLLLIIALSYTLIAGLRASIITDVIQMCMIFFIGAITVFLSWRAVGGWSTLSEGLAGTTGSINVLDPTIAFSFGIVTATSLFAGILSDQQHWQRAFAVKKTEIRKAFFFGAFVFALIPVTLSLLGFIAANPNMGIMLPTGIDVSMIGVQAVATLLPGTVTMMFVLMLLAGLFSTLDSGLSAASVLWVKHIALPENDAQTQYAARFAMVLFGAIGLGLAMLVSFLPSFGLHQLFWLSSVASTVVVIPTLLSLYWSNLTARGVYWGVLISFIIGLPSFIYANIVDSKLLILTVSIGMLLVSAFFCLIFRKRD